MLNGALAALPNKDALSKNSTLVTALADAGTEAAMMSVAGAVKDEPLREEPNKDKQDQHAQYSVEHKADDDPRTARPYSGC